MMKFLKPFVFAACLAPAARLVWLGFHQDLGANPIEYITHQTGQCILVFLLLTLSITPARKLLRLPRLIAFRRMLGLFAFFYGVLHMLTYVWLDKFFDVHEMLHDIAKRRFITAGVTGFLLMVPLALTSTKGWIRRLGGKRWQRLHRLIYFTALAGVIHFYWLVKSDVRRPLFYAGLLAILLGARVAFYFARKRASASAGRPEQVPAVAEEA